MRGHPNPQRSMLTIVALEERVPLVHPLRRIKDVADAIMERLSPEFDRMYARVGRASVPSRAAAVGPAADRPVLGLEHR